MLKHLGLPLYFVHDLRKKKNNNPFYLETYIKITLYSQESNSSFVIKKQVLHFSIFLKKWKWKLLSLVQLFATHGLYSPWNSLDQNTGVGSFSLFQGIFPTQGSNPDLLHCRQILYQLSQKESPLYIFASLLNNSAFPHYCYIMGIWFCF